MQAVEHHETSNCRAAMTLRAGQPGPLKLARRDGFALVRAPYADPRGGRLRYTAIELVVDEASLQRRPREDGAVGVRIAGKGASIRARVKALGRSGNRRPDGRK